MELTYVKLKRIIALIDLSMSQNYLFIDICKKKYRIYFMFGKILITFVIISQRISRDRFIQIN